MCLINIKVNCPHCHSTEVVKNVEKHTGIQNFLCNSYKKQFQWEYFYPGANPMVKSQVQSDLLHGTGIRDACKVFGVSPQTSLNLILLDGKKVQIIPRQKYYERIK